MELGNALRARIDAVRAELVRNNDAYAQVDAEMAQRLRLASDSWKGSQSLTPRPPSTLHTQPTGEIGGKPTGRPAEIPSNGTELDKLHLELENRSAIILAQRGYKIEQNPYLPNQAKNPDYRIEGRIFDCFTPITPYMKRIRKGIRSKLDSGQTDRIVLNMALLPHNASFIESELHAAPIVGLKELIAITRDEQVLHIYP
ncbi:hypothetical protein ACIHDR_46990 [Nocardia sp. NPDC052278]|uniref:CdiA C-terminal domain-containing protein n=1 Tax=unclassified Nocardia TaxID=2637762 RepID=UPI003677CD3E